jgi:23S rRNA (adenine2503-C2)-methyltransferase
MQSEVESQSVDLKGLLPSEVGALVEQLGQAPYRTQQILDWIHAKGVEEIGEMTNLSRSFREELNKIAHISRLREVVRRESETGQAVKFLFEIPSGERVESVLIIDGTRRTVCLSSQVGCPLDCKFCATGRMGLLRNLSAGEILDQLLQVEIYARGRGERVTNVVMMGMGEPLLNYDAVSRALKLMRLETGLGLGGRRITVSTAGYVPGIHKLAREDLNVGLAISLNATTDEVRERIMPINRRFKIADLLAAAADFFELRGRRVTFEYVLMADLTDTDEDAERLVKLTAGFPCKVNLIPYNELGEDSEFRRPSNKRLQRFYRLLEARGADFTVRESRGRDIDAACGQLFHQQENSPVVG